MALKHTQLLENAQQGHAKALQALQDDVEKRTAAFDLYRARAHTALKKNASEHKVQEERLEGMRARVGEVEGRLAEMEKERKKGREEIREAREEAEDKVQAARTEAAEWEIRMKQQEEAWREEREGWEGQLASEKKEREEERVRLEGVVNDKMQELVLLQGEVEKGRKEGKVKGDLARKLLEEKDKEIEALHRTLEQLQQQASPYARRRGNGGEESKLEEEGEVIAVLSSSSSSTPSLPPSPPPPPPPPPSLDTQSTVSTEQQIILAARHQAQRDDEVSRLKHQLRSLGETLRGHEQILRQYQHDMAEKDREVEAFRQATGRERELSEGGGKEAQDRLTYLKNVIYRYLRSPPDAARERAALVPVICTILRFSTAESVEVQQAVAAAAAAVALPTAIGEGVGYLSNLLWGGGGAGGGATSHAHPHVMTPGRRRTNDHGNIAAGDGPGFASSSSLAMSAPSGGGGSREGGSEHVAVVRTPVQQELQAQGGAEGGTSLEEVAGESQDL